MKYTKKPEIIDAIQWTGDQEAIVSFMKQSNMIRDPFYKSRETELIGVNLDGTLVISRFKIHLNDWLIYHEQSDSFSVCSNEEFARTYSTKDNSLEESLIGARIVRRKWMEMMGLKEEIILDNIDKPDSLQEELQQLIAMVEVNKINKEKDKK